MPKYSAPTSGTDAEIDEGGTSLKQMPSSPAYEHLMHTEHPAYKGSAACGFKSLGSGVFITSGKGGSIKTGQESFGGKYRSSGKNVVMK